MLRRLWLWLVAVAVLVLVPAWIALWFTRNVWIGFAQLGMVGFVLWRRLIAPAVTAAREPPPSSDR
jgi:hypothetical protein